MNRRLTDESAPFRTIQEAARLTGLSQGFIRAGVRAGSVPHIRAGTTYLVNVPLFLSQMEREAAANGGGGET